jgi:mannose-6-phosphate isomerase-like protein (cupin superfamily)
LGEGLPRPFDGPLPTFEQVARCEMPNFLVGCWDARISLQAWRRKMNGLKKAVQVGAGDDRFGKPLVFLDAYFRRKVSAQDSGGDLCIYEVIRMKKGGPLLHYHQNQDEWFFVREGEFLFQVGDNNFHLTSGDSIFAPRRVPHTFASVSEVGILMIVYQPAGTMEKFFLEGSQLLLRNPTFDAWQAFCRVHGIENVGPSLECTTTQPC